MCARAEDSFVTQAEADSIDLGSCTAAEQVQASLQVGTTARQLIMEGVIQLQVPLCTVPPCSVGVQLASRALSADCSCGSVRDPVSRCTGRILCPESTKMFAAQDCVVRQPVLLLLCNPDSLSNGTLSSHLHRRAVALYAHNLPYP